MSAIGSRPDFTILDDVLAAEGWSPIDGPPIEDAAHGRCSTSIYTLKFVAGERLEYRPQWWQIGHTDPFADQWWIVRNGVPEPIPADMVVRMADGDIVQIIGPGGGGGSARAFLDAVVEPAAKAVIDSLKPRPQRTIDRMREIERRQQFKPHKGVRGILAVPVYSHNVGYV